MPPTYRSLADAADLGAETLAIGFFDGLHRGHREVILGTGESPQVQRTLVFTFEPHPARILRPAEAPLLLTGFPHKLQILASWGVGGVLALPFDRHRSQQEAKDFLHEILAALPTVRCVRVGIRWRFGRNRQGDAHLLATTCRALGLACHIQPDVLEGDTPISSSRIRQAVAAGLLSDAARMLGRPFRLFGRVVHGRKLGSSLGFPTANLQTDDECFPPPGVYAGWAETADHLRHPCIMNLGPRPTVGDSHSRTAEAHLLDGKHALYGQDLFLQPTHFLRPIQKFLHAQALAEAIRADAARAVELLRP